MNGRWILLCAGLLGTLAAESTAGEVTIGSRVFQIPDGFELDLIAGPGLVDRPIAMSFDEQGNLYVTDSAGMSDRATEQVKTKPHRLRRLTDLDGDGRFDQSTLFAEHLMFPEGCLWYEGSVYVAAPPEIWKLTDTDGDGVSDERSVWFNGNTLTGCGNDLHGPYLGPDGWFYWCKGAFAEQSYTIHDRPFVTRSSHIFRARPDGSGMEPVLTGGMDNPVNVAFTSAGERFLSCTFFQTPANGQRDGLIHSIYGGVYGKHHDSILAHPRTGDVMPVLVHEGAAAPCGLTAASEVLWGGGHRDHLLACYFNLHQVIEHELIADGSTFTTEDRVLLSSDDPDFHPTDVLEAPEGSLLVIDTGGWYKVCCPTSQLAKPDVLGAIYRLRKSGQAVGHQVTTANIPEEPLKQLADPRPHVHRPAMAALRRTGDQQLPQLAQLIREGQSPAIRQRALWTLATIETKAARTALIPALQDTNADVRGTALQIASLWRNTELFDSVLPLLDDNDPFVSRLAAESLGRMRDDRAIPPLLLALARLPEAPVDEVGAPIEPAARVHEHALIYALLEIGNTDALKQSGPQDSPHAERGRLIALDQMRGGSLQPQDVILYLDQPQQQLARTAAWIVAQHPEWGSSLAAHFSGQFEQLPPSPDKRRQLADQLARLASAVPIQNLLEQQLKQPRRDRQLLALSAMQAAGLATTPANWIEGTTELIARPINDASLADAVVAAIQQWSLPRDGAGELRTALFNLGQNETLSASVRLNALQLATPLPPLSEDLFQWLRSLLTPEGESGLSTLAATVVGAAPLTSDQQRELLSALADAGPFELPRLLPAFAGQDEPLGLQFVKALESSPGVRGLRGDILRPVLKQYPPSVHTAADQLLQRLNPSVAQQTAQLEQLLANLPQGDVRRGHALFSGQKAKCQNCHTRGYLGGRLGPDLTRIGRVRNQRDLLEAIVFPNTSLVRGYEPVTIALNDGQVLSGIIKSESESELIVAIDAEKQQHISRTSIEEMQPSAVSLMPQGLNGVLTIQDLADLIAFLQHE